jgi:hypothetical protein
VFSDETFHTPEIVNDNSIMAADKLWLDSRSEQFSYDQTYYGAYKCNNCASLEDQIRKVLLELSLSQYIIRLLYKELNKVSAAFGPARDAAVERGACEESTPPATWTKVISKSSKYPRNGNATIDPSQPYTWRPIPVLNRFSSLSYLLDSVSGEEDVTLKSSKKVTQPYNRSFKKHSELRRNKSSSIKNCSEQQLSSSKSSCEWKDL